MLYPALVTTTRELEQILQLQEQNLSQFIGAAEMKEQGFVTLHHDLATLEKMHGLAPSVIIKDKDNVVAYALTMLRECRQLVPDLEPMFALFDKLHWNNKALNDYSFYVMGQICVAKSYRGQGFVEQLYHHHREVYQARFDLLLTEIATRNTRSMRAHERIGFSTIHIHRDELDEWAVVGWDWK
jgi:ribosomal protein S18 acetylase RimI-like enzyme